MFSIRIPIVSKLHFFQLVPAILKSLDGKPEPQQDSLLLMMIPVLGDVKAPSEDPLVKQVKTCALIMYHSRHSVNGPSVTGNIQLPNFY